MNSETLSLFKKLFEDQRQRIAFSQRLMNPEFLLSSDELSDESDLAAVELETSMRLRMRNREALYSKKVEEALRRINEGTFGACEECEEEIELKRLEARPTATLCVSCKENSEKTEHLHADGHRYKSEGQLMNLKLAAF